MHIVSHHKKNFGYVEIKSRSPCIAIPTVISTVTRDAWEIVPLTQQVFTENPMSVSHTSDVVVLVLDIPCCYFYIKALNKTLHFGFLEQIKFMAINFTLRFPPYNRDL